MKRFFIILFLSAFLGSTLLFTACAKAEKNEHFCLTGAFLADRPSVGDIKDFYRDYGKRPFLVMIFTDWNKFPDGKAVKGIYSSGSTPFITWEPWKAYEKEAIDYDGLIRGNYDEYIRDFSARLKNLKKPVFLRFAHEMNGNWYPWAGTKIGPGKYIAMYRHVKDIFDKGGVKNVKWVFSVNWENVPRGNNSFLLYYPGSGYADYVGIDGYNWGNVKSWSKWMSFKEIFGNIYDEITDKINKPVMISEFSSTSSGGDKAEWIRNALEEIKKMKKVKAFVLFNVDKETDWSFSADEKCGKELKKKLADTYFKDSEPVVK